jgi:chromosome partitioning protein
MQYGALRTLRSSPYILVVGSGKGGSGKTTLAMHLAVGLLKAGQKVGTVDLDSDQGGLTLYMENRRIWANWRRIELDVPLHRRVASPDGGADQSEPDELAAFEQAMVALERCDFVVIDTPPRDGYLVRLAHMLADTIVAPLRDSFLDLCVLGSTDPVTHEIRRTGCYARMIELARKMRGEVDPGYVDWIALPNRATGAPLIRDSLGELGLRMGFRTVPGCSEDVTYRRLFPLGLTVLDSPDVINVSAQGPSYDAEAEMRSLINSLRLPINERGLRRAAARSEWLMRKELPLAVDELLVEDV